MKTILTILILFASSFTLADAPKDAVRVMRPYPSICTPTLESLVTAMTIDYAVHVAATFEESPSSYIMVLENPDAKSMAIIHINIDGKACMVFSGKNLKKFDRPAGMAPPLVDINDPDESV